MRGVSKRFGPVEALDGVELRVRPATVHALVGENGAGKSTLMKILAGVHQADQGEMLVDGTRRRWSSPAEALAGGVAMIYQELSLAPELTVAENVFLGAEPRGRLPWTVDRAEMASRTAALAAEHGFDAVDPEACVEELGVAECQVVEVLKALARRASILVLDEPTSSLGRDEAAALLEMVDGLRRRGVTLLYISHRLEEIEALADEVTVLRDGRSVHSGPMAELDLDTLVRHMVGRELGDYFPQRAPAPGALRLEVAGLSTAAGVAEASFELRGGEILGVAGLVGSGRTALARALAGVDEIDGGEARLDGAPLRPAGPAEALARGVLYLTEDRKRSGLCLELPAVWNVTLPCLTALGMRFLVRPRREQELVEPVAQKLALRWSGPEALAVELSGGNQQKLLLARALLAGSQLLILDEPTRGVDVGAKVDIYRLLSELAAEGKAILFISSELTELLGVTDRLLVMRDGRTVASLVAAEASQEEVMRHMAVERREAS